jgi:hypothetical protein
MTTDRHSPPEISETVRREYEAAGAGAVLVRTLSAIDETILLAERDRTLLSSAPVVDVLAELPYDPDDTVYVVWRADRHSNFWTQARKDRYLAHLRDRAAENGGFINQTRIMVFDDRGAPPDIATPDNILPDDHILFSLLPLHKAGTFLAASQDVLADYPEVAKLRFGYTLSVRHGYAVISIPFAEDIEPSALATDRIADYLGGHRDYNDADGPMRTLITVNQRFVALLLEQTQALIADDRVEERQGDVGRV